MMKRRSIRRFIRLPSSESFGRTGRSRPYPPGIATIVPGERLDERARPMLDYLKIFERAANLFPGFDADLQGTYREIAPDGSVRF
jgi:ornithine decarboxylase